MKIFSRSIAVWAMLLAVGCMAGEAQQGRGGANVPEASEQIFALGNQARAEAGAPPLKLDQALSAAALAHCRRMVAEGAIGHRYAGELDLAERAGAAGAHFALIEENVAEAPTAAEIHGAWMESAGHRKNLLNPEVDRVGIAVVARGGQLYVVADYARGSASLSAAQVEERVAQLIAVSGVHATGGSATVRAACAVDHGMPSGAESGFVMRWQDADITRLPDALTARLAGGHYRRAEVGSCPAHGSQRTFTIYRVAVLLY
jgi:hypothetical protein